jgi:hypothetical protein
MATDDSPSGDALDRAQKMLDRHGYDRQTRARMALIENIAKLIDAADVSAATEVKPLEQYLPDVLGRLTGRGRMADRHESAADELLRREPAPYLLAMALAELEWFSWRCDGQRADLNRAAATRDELVRKLDRERADRITAQRIGHEVRASALTTSTTDQLLEELRRRLNT